MRSRTTYVAAALVGALCAACATGPLSPGEPRAVERLALAPYATHEQCADVEVGDRLDYRYESSAPVDFDVHYRDDNVVVAPIVRPHSRGDSDIFEARVPAHYCVAWQAGPEGAVLGYTLVLRRGR